MLQIGLIGLAAGAAAALLFASVASGAWLSVAMFYLAPLPILIAALGWSHWAALIAALVGALALAAVFGSVFFFAFLAGAGVPAWWLGYLAMLARPITNGGEAGGTAALEWYPPGRLVTWAAIARRAGGDRGDPQFRQRRGKLPRRPARRADAHSARGNRHRGGRAALGARRQECQQAGRFPGDRRAAGSRGRRHHHQPGQSVACRPHREGLRTAQAAVAATFQHDVSHAGCRAARRSPSIFEFFRRPDRHRGRRFVGEPVDGLWRCSVSPCCTRSRKAWAAAPSCSPASMPR